MPFALTKHSIRGLSLALAAATALAAPASAMTFTLSTAPGTTLSQAQSAAFTTAGAAWSSILTDNINVKLEVGFATLGAGVLGSTSLSLASLSTAGLLASLAADAKSANDAKAMASLNALPPAIASLEVTTAQAKALGYAFNGIDAVIEFSNSFNFATSRNADGSTPSGAYDLIGVAEHEIGHALGFVSSFDYNSAPSLLDLFRFTGANTRASAAGTASFSLDDGATALATFSPGGSGQYQASHWFQGTGALMDPAVATGVTKNVTALDIQALDVLGYDVAVPEPASAFVLLAGFAGVVASRRAGPAGRRPAVALSGG